MCGIIGGVYKDNITPTLIAGLKLLEYRGYDSAGIAVLSSESKIKRMRAVGKIKNLETNIKNSKYNIEGTIGIAHTRWATHGKPTNYNAHPHISNGVIGVVHNGIIENFLTLKKQQLSQGYKFTSDTDTEVIAHEIHKSLKNSKTLLQAVSTAVKAFDGAYSIGVISPQYPQHIIASCKGSPLIIGVSKNGNFIASDKIALLNITKNFIFLEEEDIADITLNSVTIFDKNGKKVKRHIKISKLTNVQIKLGKYKHYMLKEIFEQPQAIKDTLKFNIIKNAVPASIFGKNAEKIFKQIKQIQIIACGTSYHAGLVAKYWFEDIIKIQCNVEVASEHRYRNPVVLDNTLFVAISQSGETADTLEAIKNVKKLNKNIHILCICNSKESSLTRVSELIFLTNAGNEICVASTKAFTTQLVALILLVTAVGICNKKITKKQEKAITDELNQLPALIVKALKQQKQIEKLAKNFKNKRNAIFLGRGIMYAIAMEGALKLKEVSYIHAEAYPAGELKHGPIALIDKTTPVIAVAPNDKLLNKLKSNLQEVKSRGSEMIVFEDKKSFVTPMQGLTIISSTTGLSYITTPIIFNIPLQLLSYHVALIKGTNIDQPRNLAKSVTVE